MFLFDIMLEILGVDTEEIVFNYLTEGSAVVGGVISADSAEDAASTS